VKGIWKVISVAVLGIAGAAAHAQSFGLPLMKAKVTLQRKLPAFVQLPGDSVHIIVTGHADTGYLAEDFKSLLSTELLKDDPRLRITDTGADSVITCTITDFEHAKPTTTTRPGVQTGKTAPPPVAYTRVTGIMRVSFLARTKTGKTIGSDNVVSKFDEEFDTSGNSVSGGAVGAMKNGLKRITGGAKSEDMNPPTDSELRSKLLDGAVKQIVTQVVNTREFVEVQLAKGKGPIDQGVKEAQSGLWSRALETWEAAPPLPKPIDDAYRMYDVGVAYEAMGYAADDEQAAVKFLQQAAIQYGKAIDSNPAEKYFLQPQRRIETALAHYSKLEKQKKTPPPADPSPAAKPPVTKPAAKRVQK
jgi:hypothetical protein